MAIAIAPTIFQLLDATEAGAASGVLGLWGARPMPPGAVVFDSTPLPSPAWPMWRVIVPADPHLARARLARAEATLVASQAALPAADGRLRAFARAGTGDVAFDLHAAGTATGRPEITLSALLREASTGNEIAFGPSHRLSPSWSHAAARLQDALHQLGQAIAHYAWVETYAADRRLGWSVAGWLGDMNTVWLAGIGPEQMALHQRALALALASRATLLRMIFLAARGAVLLSTAVSTPFGPLLALPAAWTFVDEVLAESRERRALP